LGVEANATAKDALNGAPSSANAALGTAAKIIPTSTNNVRILFINGTSYQIFRDISPKRVTGTVFL
jgi:hypothetical protein